MLSQKKGKKTCEPAPVWHIRIIFLYFHSKYFYSRIELHEKLTPTCLGRSLKLNLSLLNRSPKNAYVEGDASSASYFLAGAAITGGTVTAEGCGTTSLQVKFCEMLFCPPPPACARPTTNKIWPIHVYELKV
jgi:hypothetical protein